MSGLGCGVETHQIHTETAELAVEQAMFFDSIVKDMVQGETALPAGACFIALLAVAQKLKTYLKVQSVTPLDMSRLEKIGSALGDRLVAKTSWGKEIA